MFILVYYIHTYKHTRSAVTFPIFLVSSDSKGLKRLNMCFIFENHIIISGEPAKLIFGQSWDFVLTGWTPPHPHSPNVGILQKEKIMFILHFRQF